MGKIKTPNEGTGGQCKYCGKAIKTKSTWGYGSPIVYCSSCGKENFLDNIREPAVEGLLPITTNPIMHLKFAGLALGIAVIAELFNLMVRNGYYLSMRVMAALFVLAAIYEVGMCLWIALGGAKKSNERYMRESEERLQNPEYVKKLMGYGYVVPEKYRMLVEEERDEYAE